MEKLPLLVLTIYLEKNYFKFIINQPSLDNKTSPPIYYRAGRVGPHDSEGSGSGGVRRHTVASDFSS